MTENLKKLPDGLHRIGNSSFALVEGVDNEGVVTGSRAFIGGEPHSALTEYNLKTAHTALAVAIKTVTKGFERYSGWPKSEDWLVLCSEQEPYFRAWEVSPAFVGKPIDQKNLRRGLSLATRTQILDYGQNASIERQIIAAGFDKAHSDQDGIGNLYGLPAKDRHGFVAMILQRGEDHLSLLGPATMLRMSPDWLDDAPSTWGERWSDLLNWRNAHQPPLYAIDNITAYHTTSGDEPSIHWRNSLPSPHYHMDDGSVVVGYNSADRLFREYYPSEAFALEHQDDHKYQY